MRTCMHESCEAMVEGGGGFAVGHTGFEIGREIEKFIKFKLCYM